MAGSLSSTSPIIPGRVVGSPLVTTSTGIKDGRINPFGNIDIVLVDPEKEGTLINGIRPLSPETINGRKDNRFRFMHFEPTSLERRNVLPDFSTAPGTNTVDHVGFPMLSYLQAFDTGTTTTTTTTLTTTVLDVSEDVMSFEIKSALDNRRPTLIEKTGSLVLYNKNNEYSDFLTRARGVKVWVKWDTAATATFTDDDLLFSGIAYGRTQSLEPTLTTVTFELKDHWRVLEKVKIKNSPFYDGFPLPGVIEDLAQRGGINFIDDLEADPGHNKLGYFFLSSGYSFQTPAHRYEADQSLKDCMVQAIQHFSRYMYFDGDGVLHYAVIPGDNNFEKTTAGWDADVKETYYLDPDSAAGTAAGSVENYFRLVLNKIVFESSLNESVYNSFLVRSVNRVDNRMIIETTSLPSSISDPNSIGYLGYVAELTENRPSLGSVEATKVHLGIIKEKYKRPGYLTDITTVGHHTNFRPGQFIRIKDDDSDTSPDIAGQVIKKARVTDISNTYSAEQNDWSTKISMFQVHVSGVGFAGGTITTP
jgi:hypothetical protein